MPGMLSCKRAAKKTARKGEVKAPTHFIYPRMACKPAMNLSKVLRTDGHDQLDGFLKPSNLDHNLIEQTAFLSTLNRVFLLKLLP